MLVLRSRVTVCYGDHSAKVGLQPILRRGFDLRFLVVSEFVEQRYNHLRAKILFNETAVIVNELPV